MSELSAAEKRKLLRERRQAKMTGDSTQRLTKIVGNNSSFIKVPEEQPKQKAQHSNRISQSFTTGASENSVFDDPPLSSLENLEEIPDPLHGNNANVNMEQLLAQIMKAHQGPDSAHSASGDNSPLPTDFMATMGSLMNNPNLAQPSGGEEPAGSDPGSISQEAKERYSSIFSLLRYFVILAIYFKTCLFEDQCYVSLEPFEQLKFIRQSWFSFSFLNYIYEPPISQGCSLWFWFVSVECVFSAISLSLASRRFLPNRSKDGMFGIVLQFVPPKYSPLVNNFVNYIDILFGLWKDFALMLVLLVAKAFF